MKDPPNRSAGSFIVGDLGHERRIQSSVTDEYRMPEVVGQKAIEDGLRPLLGTERRAKKKLHGMRWSRRADGVGVAFRAAMSLFCCYLSRYTALSDVISPVFCLISETRQKKRVFRHFLSN